MKLLRATPILASALLLAACSTTPTTTTADAPASPTTQTRIQPGTFDRNDPDFQFLDICSKINEDHMKELGLELMGERKFKPETPSSTCTFDIPAGDGWELLSVNMGPLSDEEFTAQVTKLEDDVSEKIEGVWTFSVDEVPLSGECDVTTQTSGGRLWVTYSAIEIEDPPLEQSCQTAIDYLEKIYEVLELQ